MDFRRPFDAYGCHRVLSPQGALPQAADRLDNEDPPFANEAVIDVERLNIDSASFHQLVDEAREAGAETDDAIGEAVGARVAEIVGQRGKMQNPVTGSGGMLLGTIGAVGEAYEGPELAVGDRVATLVSLTLTPLHIEQVREVDLAADQVAVDARAYLPPSAPLVQMPDDIDDAVALSIFDVCGAPAQTRRLCREAGSVLILGAGKSGMLCAAAARDGFSERDDRDEGASEDTWIGCIDLQADGPEYLADHDLVDAWSTGDATDPTAILEVTRQLVAEGPSEVDALPDLVINTCNVPGTEMAAILSCRDRGTVYFFNMATQFSRAALGAEGVGRDVDLLIGNGYAHGHADYALELVRKYPAIWEKLQKG